MKRIVLVASRAVPPHLLRTRRCVAHANPEFSGDSNVHPSRKKVRQQQWLPGLSIVQEIQNQVKLVNRVSSQLALQASGHPDLPLAQVHRRLMVDRFVTGVEALSKLPPGGLAHYRLLHSAAVMGRVEQAA